MRAAAQIHALCCLLFVGGCQGVRSGREYHPPVHKTSSSGKSSGSRQLGTMLSAPKTTAGGIVFLRAHMRTATQRDTCTDRVGVSSASRALGCV